MSFGKYNDYTSILIRFAYMKHTFSLVTYNSYIPSQVTLRNVKYLHFNQNLRFL
jgi:hypothetical protein